MRTSVLDTPSSELVRRAINQDQEAFRELYEFYERPLEKRLFYLVKDREVADDLYQETFISVWEYFLSPEAATSGIEDYFDKWVYRVARNLAFTHLRRKKKVEFISLPEFAAFEVEGHEDIICDLLWVNEAIEALSPKYKESFVLRVIRGYSERETAAETGIKEKSVSANVSRAREHLNALYVQVNVAYYRDEGCWRQSVEVKVHSRDDTDPRPDDQRIIDYRMRPFQQGIGHTHNTHQSRRDFRIVLFIAFLICDR